MDAASPSRARVDELVPTHAMTVSVRRSQEKPISHDYHPDCRAFRSDVSRPLAWPRSRRGLSRAGPPVASASCRLIPADPVKESAHLAPGGGGTGVSAT